MPSTYIPDEHSVIRYVPWSKLAKDEDDNVTGILAIAFRLRETEDFLSASWVEYFDGLPQQQLRDCVDAIRNSAMNVGGKSAFAIGCVADIKSACQANNRRLRVIHEREDDNDAHVALRNWPRDDDNLLNIIIQEEIWGRYVMNADI